jgi:thiol-disulfide isomerase/thioredoxin
MKKNALILLFLATNLSFQTGFAQTSYLRPFTISGVWERGNPTEILLFEVISGRLEKVSVALVQNDGAFAMAYNPSAEGFFIIGTGDPLAKTNQYTFYFKPGDQLNIIVNEIGYTLVGDNTRENMVMKNWHDFIQPPEWNEFYLDGKNPTITPQEFFRVLETKIEKPYVPARTGNSNFDRAFAKYHKFDFMYNALWYLSMLPVENIPIEDFPDYFRLLKMSDLTSNTDILMFPNSIYGLLPNVMWIESKLTHQQKQVEMLIYNTENDTIKGEIFLMRILPDVNDILTMQDVNARYEKHIVTDDQKRRFNQEIERIYSVHVAQGVGKQGIDFTFQDVNGNKVSFSDFRGKVVYVDVWATWCGPCIAEIPAKRKLKEHFAGNTNIVFMSISIDNPRDIQKWKDFVANHNLDDVQLHGNIDGPTNISRLYNITGIPRFLLFDKQGNIVSLDAQRPSSTRLIPILTRLLKQ